MHLRSPTLAHEKMMYSKNKFRVRVLMVLIDNPDCKLPLQQLMQHALFDEFTMICSWR